MDSPTADQRRVLNLIYSEFRRTGRQPTYQWIDRLVDGEGLSLRVLVDTMPEGLMTPDPSWSSGYYGRKEDELLVTVKGLLYCGDEALADLDLLARVLRYFADREQAFAPSEPHQAEDLIIRGSELSDDLGLDVIERRKAYVLLQQFENRLRFSSGGEDENWSWTLDCEAIRKYRDVDGRIGYLRARGDLPEPEPTTVWGRASRLASRAWRWIRSVGRRLRLRTPGAVRTFTHNPLVVAAVAAAIGGLVSALIALYLS